MLEWSLIERCWDNSGGRGFTEKPEPLLQVRVVNPPESPKGRLPVEGQERPAVDWWPTNEVEARYHELARYGPYVCWEPTRSGVMVTAEALAHATGADRIAVWVEAAIWEQSRHWAYKESELILRPVWDGIRAAAFHKVKALRHRHHLCTTALPAPYSLLTDQLDDWLAPDLTSGEHNLEALVARIVGYAALRRFLVISEWTLVDVAAVRRKPHAVGASCTDTAPFESAVAGCAE